MTQDRPCRCNQFVGPVQPWGLGNCHLCWTYHTSNEHNILWGGPGIPPQEPGVAKKISHFLKAVSEHALAGMPTTSEEDAGKRMAICLACPSMPDKVAKKCVECGCYMQVKVTWNEQKCPLGKW